MEFKSQICTTREQSKRLLKLGLKNETADMMYITDKNVPDEYRLYRLIPGYSEQCPEYLTYIPAWSLHRLMEIAEANDIAFLDISKMYNTCIKIIEGRIYAGLINKDYLEEKK